MGGLELRTGPRVPPRHPPLNRERQPATAARLSRPRSRRWLARIFSSLDTTVSIAFLRTSSTATELPLERLYAHISFASSTTRRTSAPEKLKQLAVRRHAGAPAGLALLVYHQHRRAEVVGDNRGVRAAHELGQRRKALGLEQPGDRRLLAAPRRGPRASSASSSASRFWITAAPPVSAEAAAHRPATKARPGCAPAHHRCVPG
jgi:hypothetical protein